ncbi:hypothetical protein AK812_SmicGene820 [Symbiodinium microadriaticum]|uniref:Uncharacterized protein n=1 Tax=Symbiodinium microadriaticum TaxID=2951 RepID=A0A1Q9F5M2_SYMMI|nr:hypothetical protein AK812_SmicGene820 [Symbiodinium microadriaticum]
MSTRKTCFPELKYLDGDDLGVPEPLAEEQPVEARTGENLLEWRRFPPEDPGPPRIVEKRDKGNESPARGKLLAVDSAVDFANVIAGAQYRVWQIITTYSEFVFDVHLSADY